MLLLPLLYRNALPSSVKPADEVAFSWQQRLNAVQAQRIHVLEEQLANVLGKGSPSWSHAGRSAAANAHPSAAGLKCNICGFPNRPPKWFLLL
jgi:hypothetical protein